MQVIFSGLRIPVNEGISGFNLPGGRAPPQAGHGPLLDKSDILEMIADDLPIAEVMVLSCPVRKQEKLCIGAEIEYVGR